MMIINSKLWVEENRMVPIHVREHATDVIGHLADFEHE